MRMAPKPGYGLKSSTLPPRSGYVSKPMYKLVAVKRLQWPVEMKLQKRVRFWSLFVAFRIHIFYNGANETHTHVKTCAIPHSEL